MTAIVLFDGECGLCTRSVQFILRHEARPELRFASLQSKAGRQILAEHGVEGECADGRSVVLVSDGRVYTRSTAALQIAACLSGPWRLLRLLRIVPRPLRDLVYDWIARRRHAWSARADVCVLPGPEFVDRFLPMETDVEQQSE